jgi:hypothetical protein
MTQPQRTAQPQTAKNIDDLNRGLLAAWRGALDSATLGLADKGVAAAQATLDTAGGRDWGRSYDATRAQQTAEDQFEQAHFPAYRQSGEVAGAIAPLLLTDGLTAMPSAARIAFTAPKLAPDLASAVRFARPWAAVAGAGAGVSVAGQGVSDAASGHLSSPQTYAADMAGGAAAGLATLARSPTAGAAAGAGASALTYSALTGQPIDWGDTAKNAVAGSTIGLLGHFVGTQASNSLAWRDKGQFGEWLARQTSNILGDDITPPPENSSRYAGIDVSGGKTIPDLVTDQGPVEAKFGRSARLSKRQGEAFNELDNYHVYHFLPEDIGRITGGLLAIGAQPQMSQPAPSPPQDDSSDPQDDDDTSNP